jgi:hypothetical protein
VLRGAFRRIALLVAVVVGFTAVASLILGALDHADLLRALAVGFYVVGAAVLICSFVIGVRGPLRPEWGDRKDGELPAPRGGLAGGILPRAVRRATGDERSDSKRNSIGLFLFGIALVLIGTGFDPTRHAF